MNNINVSGPLFDGRAEMEINRWCNGLERDLAEEALRDLHGQFHTHFKHPTGYYESHVHVQSTPGRHEVTDGGVVYGHWLEGDGSRNFPVTRFRGYASFRRVTQRINAKAVRMARERLPELLRRIG